MKKVSVIYWSGTGNTAAMADAIAQSAKESGADVNVCAVAQAAPDFIDSDVIVLGCPSMGSEVLEESEMEPFMAMTEAKLKGKNVALFGSYGWGDGQWMRDWQDRVTAAGANLVAEGLIVAGAPDEAGLAACSEFGKKIAA